jgi:hypothetical protein
MKQTLAKPKKQQKQKHFLIQKSMRSNFDFLDLTTCTYYHIQVPFSNLQVIVHFTHRDLNTRVRPRFFDQVGHETMCAFSRNKHFFSKSFHHQTYQNYEQPPQTSQNSYIQSYFFVSKIG